MSIKERLEMKKYRIKIVRKVNHLMRFIGSLNRASKSGFDKYCKKKEILYAISKIIDIEDLEWIEIDKNKSCLIHRDTILNASNNIIDLIEVGDYVNGHRVDKVVIDPKCSYVLLEEVGCYVDSQEDIADYEIKSIVTKEQISQMEYRVETN